MEIIPVIDVMGEKVVHARAGIRAEYQLLQSVLTNSCEPLQVITDLLAWHPFSTIYIADLDAILEQKVNTMLYQQLEQQFPAVTFWLDAGIRAKTNWSKLAGYKNIKPVIGSETVVDTSWLTDPEVQQNSILSLDFQQVKFLGQQQIFNQAELWTENVIAMNLDHVGMKSGPDFELLAVMGKQSKHSQIIAAGGIRDQQDLVDLQQQGIEQVLVASALHNGTISNRVLISIK